MICLEVYLNDKKICVAGVDESGLVTAIVTVIPHRPQEIEKGLPLADFRVGGLVNNEHVRWTEPEKSDLKIGDEVTFKVIELETADEPVKKCPRKKHRKKIRSGQPLFKVHSQTRARAERGNK